MSYKNIKLLKKQGINLISRDTKRFLVDVKDFGDIYKKGSGYRGFLKSLSNLGAARDLKSSLKYLYEARKNNKPIILFLDEKNIYTGLNMAVIDLIQRGWISLISVNSDFAVYDFEIALSGKSVEDFERNLIKNKKGYGNTEETGIFFNIALKEGIESGLGAGESLGHYLIENKFIFKRLSVLYSSYKYNIPLTIHSTTSFEIIGFHPTFDPVVFGKLLDKDFILLSSVVSKLSNGGVLLFLNHNYEFLNLIKKAIAFNINSLKNIEEFYSIVMGNKKIYDDFTDSLLNGGKKFYLGDSIEILLPLLTVLIVDLGGKG